MATEKRLIVLQDAIDIIVNTPSEIAHGVTSGSKKHWTANDVLGVLADRQFEIFVLLDMVKRVDAVEVIRCKNCASGKGATHKVCQLYRDGLMKDDDFCSVGERKENA